MMKKILFTLLVLFTLASTNVFAQMSDQQVINFIQTETKAGTSQSQIVTKLVQRGVKIDQIRRMRQQYNAQISNSGQSSRIDAATNETVSRLRSQNQSTQNYNTLSEEDVEDRAMTVGKTDYGQADLLQEPDLQYTEQQQDIEIKEETTVASDSIKVFGRDIFNKKLLSFEPNMNIATPQNYVLGPGDDVYIDIYGASQKSGKFQVSPEGNIVIPGYGPIYVGGLTIAGAEKKLRATLGSRFKSSQLSTTVGNTRSMMINVVGEVKAPGTYTLSAFSTVFHALYMAGGINNLGTLRDIKVFRNGKQITVVDVYQYILNGRLAGNIRLQENDMIIVGPYDCLVNIQGNVKRPMYYEMRPSESVSQIIKYAGGFTGDAYKKAVRLTRKSGERYSVHTVEEFDMTAFKLADGDMITVDAMINRYENMVEVRGAVFRPGQYELGRQINTVRALVESAGGLTEDAFMGRAVMYRMKEDRTLETQSLDISGIMAGSSPDVPLRNEDVLFIGTQAERLAERIVTISGEVMMPGSYQYAEKETIEDLIIRAGGLTDAASIAKIDLSRRIRDSKALKSGEEISKNYSFSVKEGLIIDGQQNFTLEPYDVVQVRRSPGYIEPRNVSVEGEVCFEGSFTLSKKNQRLSDLIKAAGGVTSEAYVKGTRLERKLNDDERARMELVLNTARQGLTGKDSIAIERLSTVETYIVGIDLEKALANPGGDFDVVVRDGDRIIVPEYSGTVKISGNVLLPNTVSYQKGKSWKYYVNQAGGFAQRSRKSHSFIVYQNGTISQVGKGEVEPGCEIVVPQRAKRDLASLTPWIGIGSSLASLATMIVALTKL